MNRRPQSALFVLTLWLCAASLLPAATTQTPLSNEHRLEILRLLAYEYATTLQPLPASRSVKEAVEVNAEGLLNENKLRQTLANRGAAVQPGEIVQITGIEFQRETILVEINGGGKKKKKWYERIIIQGSGGSIGGGAPPPQQAPPPGSGSANTLQGSWVRLNFDGRIPDLSGTQVKELLATVLDFSRQSAAVPWIESIPEEFREAIKNKKAMVGMDRQMVLAAKGRPDRKVREVKNNIETEEWLYGNPPFVTFVVFVGETVIEVKEFR
ncbi:MAG: hypothetical protein ACRD4D_07270 [Candidatus Acidiferrales bacterium]